MDGSVHFQQSGHKPLKPLDIIFDPFRVTFALMRKKCMQWRGPVGWDNTDPWSTVGKIRQIYVIVTVSGRDVWSRCHPRIFRPFSKAQCCHKQSVCLSEVFQEWGPTRPLIQRVNWALLPLLKRLRYQADYSFTPSVEAKNAWDYKGTPSCVFIAWCLTL